MHGKQPVCFGFERCNNVVVKLRQLLTLVRRNTISRSPLRSFRRLVESRELSDNLGTYVAYRVWKPKNLVKVPECLPDSDLRPIHLILRTTLTPSGDLVKVIFRQQSQELFYNWGQKPRGLSAFTIGFLRVSSADWFTPYYSSMQPFITNGICEYPRNFGSITLHLRNVPLLG